MSSVAWAISIPVEASVGDLLVMRSLPGQHRRSLQLPGDRRRADDVVVWPVRVGRGVRVASGEPVGNLGPGVVRSIRDT